MRDPNTIGPRGRRLRIAVCSLALGALVIAADAAQAQPDSALLARGINPHPAILVRPLVHPLSAMAQLGDKLFHDPGLSGSGKMSCASCHDSAHAYGPPGATPVMSGGADMHTAGFRADGDDGVAVVVLTIIVRFFLFPLSRRAVQAQLAMKKIAPDKWKHFFVGIAIMIYFEHFQQKVTPDARLAMKGYHEMENPLNFKIELTNEYFANEAGDYYARFGWGAFHAFKVDKQCILLYTGHSSHSGMVVIRKKELTSKELEEFCSFLRKKMAELR